MSSLAPGPDPRELQISDADFRALAQIVHADSGIRLAESKKGLVVSRLSRRLRALGLADFAAYRNLVAGAGGVEERRSLISALTTNVTRFFREDHHFQELSRRILPPLVARARAGGRVRLWSAGCSTGEEPYSLAMQLLELCAEAERLDIRILATDIDPQVIATAHAGSYPEAALDPIPEAMRRKHFPGTGGSGGQRAIGPQARALVEFAPLNLIGAWPMRRPFDIIFCRNVVIYFDAQTQEALWPRFAAALHCGGHLFIGHSERLGRSAGALFENDGITLYRRTAAEAPLPGGREPERRGESRP